MKSLVITEKSNQAKNVLSAVGNQYGEVLAAQGHLLELQEPEDVNSAWTWAEWDFELLRPESGFFKTQIPRKAPDNIKRKIAAIGDALKTADRVIIATDDDVEGQVIGQELVEFFDFKGEVLRATFNEEDDKSLQKAFSNLRPNEEFQHIYSAGIARQQSDQIYNLILTRVASKSIKPPEIQGALGIGRVKTATLGMICKRENEITGFTPVNYYQIVASVTASDGTILLRHDPEKYGNKEKLLSEDQAQQIVLDAENWNGLISVSGEEKRKGPPKFFGLPQLQALFGSRKGWAAEKTLSVLQSLYDVHKIISYPRADAQYVGETQVGHVPAILQGLATIDGFSDRVPDSPEVRTGKKGHYYDKGLAGSSHHAIIPNMNSMDGVAEIYKRLSEDERAVFDIIANNFIAAMWPDWIYNQTVVVAEISGREFRAVGNVTTSLGWKTVNADTAGDEDEEKDEDAATLPNVSDGENVLVASASTERKTTKPPARFNQGSIITAMKNAWQFVEDADLKEQLKSSEGIGTNATRGTIIEGLFRQGQIELNKKHIVATAAGMLVYKTLREVTPALVDPGTSAAWGILFADVRKGERSMESVVDEISANAVKLMDILKSNKNGTVNAPSEKMLVAARRCAERAGIDLPEGADSNFQACKAFLDTHMKKKLLSAIT